MKSDKIQIPKTEVKQLQNILKRKRYYPDAPKDGTIVTFTATFDNGYQADIKVCNGDNQSSPFIDPVLFDSDGNELAIGDPCWTILGEYLFEYEDETYQVLVEAV